MAAKALLLFMLMMSSIHVGKMAESLISVSCKPAVGVVGQITHIFCSIKSEIPEKPSVNWIVLTRLGEKLPCFTLNPPNQSVTGDSRYKVENETSLQLHNTKVSDEGEYKYVIRTSHGKQETKFSINVTAKYSHPVISSEQEELVNHGAADLLCKASGGYPAGSIHWFDQSNTNWTKSATLQRTQGNDGLFSLSSKLSFNRFDSLWAPFRCVVLNSTYQEEGGSNSMLKIENDPVKLSEETNNSVGNNSAMKNGVAAVVVIGSLIVGLLIVILFKRKRVKRPIPPEGPNPEEEDALNDPGLQEII